MTFEGLKTIDYRLSVFIESKESKKVFCESTSSSVMSSTVALIILFKPQTSSCVCYHTLTQPICSTGNILLTFNINGVKFTWGFQFLNWGLKVFPS